MRFTSLITRLRGHMQRDPIHIMPHRGFGNSGTLHLGGRLLEDEGVVASEDDDTVWENVVAMVRRFESDEVGGVTIRASFQETVQEAVTDSEGYFAFQIPVTQALDPKQLWHEVSLQTVDTRTEVPVKIRTTGEVLIPPAQSRFGVISDLDDTVLQSQATELLKMARLLFLNNARTRLPFDGVADFYTALRNSSPMPNPIFYVSSSPWNLYDMIVEFMDIHRIPAGPLFLRDFGLNLKLLGSSGHHGHKLHQIERILSFYDKLPFILIGDSGQEDPEIYAQVVRENPGRILVIYIRDVTLEERDSEVDALIEEVRGSGVEMLRVADTQAAAEHAAAHGFIEPDAAKLIAAKQ